MISSRFIAAVLAMSALMQSSFSQEWTDPPNVDPINPILTTAPKTLLSEPPQPPQEPPATQPPAPQEPPAPQPPAPQEPPAPQPPAPQPEPRESPDGSDDPVVNDREEWKCKPDVGQKIFILSGSNRDLFEKCVVEGTYQIFPYAGVLPNQEQLIKMAQSTACTTMFTAVLLLQIPQCFIGGLAVKAAVETLIKISMDLRDGGSAPTPSQFLNMVRKRAGLNVALERGEQLDQKDEFFQQYSHQLWRAFVMNRIELDPETFQVKSMDESGSVDGEASSLSSMDSDIMEAPSREINASINIGDSSSESGSANNLPSRVPNKTSSASSNFDKSIQNHGALVIVVLSIMVAFLLE